MTNMHKGYIITLENDIDEDDSEYTIFAIKRIKGVVDVTPIVDTPESAIAEHRVRNMIGNKLLEFIRQEVWGNQRG